ncbi:NAD(P)-binding protein [Coccomyxa subellipsoidea C-169]|uniref:NAD(P)-binding protein n=1 Tax=Coccomyxa subellipsoidea (strain C-169) TaxID=574566 RepID=I0YXU5_COCSC|nr:NAD(P)-binding protein [Coccomyxa subellipsoidea C-169]EIE23214.1 NAD(P)-binding protein [Coccomyxa subellipsoidea C-169]|eukprot:XP_005647758.1 NAD(P)-binding protein [Coccomyxa subellipsoidea C-169]
MRLTAPHFCLTCLSLEVNHIPYSRLPRTKNKRVLVVLDRADADLKLLSSKQLPRDAFKNKVVWITGASQGLGEQLALTFAEHGARLILSARNKDRLEQVGTACKEAYGTEVEVLPLDVCAPFADLQGAAAKADDVFDGAGVDYFIHNAGASQHAAVEDTTTEVAEKMFELNVLGPIALTRAALPFLLSRGHCRIVVVSSMAAVVPAPGQAMYSATKLAMHGYFSTLQAELNDRRAPLNLSCPGPIATGTEGTPRNVFSAQVLTKPVHLSTHEERGGAKKRLSPPRVAELIARAAYNRADVAWIARHPVLLLGYLCQYWPTLGIWIMKKIGPLRAAQLKSGGSGYDIKSMLFGTGRVKSD